MSLLCVVDLNRSKRVCVQSATGVYLTALPAPGGIQIAGKTPGDLSSEHISSIQKRINDTIAVNKELYQINPPVRQSTLADTVNLWKLIFVIKPEKSHLSGQVCGNVGLFPTAVAVVSCMKPFSTTELKKFTFMMFRHGKNLPWWIRYNITVCGHFILQQVGTVFTFFSILKEKISTVYDQEY